jgi:hypothetical protein
MTASLQEARGKTPALSCEMYFDVLSKAGGSRERVVQWLATLFPKDAPLSDAAHLELVAAAPLTGKQRALVFQVVMTRERRKQRRGEEEGGELALTEIDVRGGSDREEEEEDVDREEEEEDVDREEEEEDVDREEEEEDVDQVARDAGAPSNFFCPISTELMRDPVRTSGLRR